MSPSAVAYGGPKAARDKGGDVRTEESAPPKQPYHAGRDSDLVVVVLVISLLIAGMIVVWQIWRRRTQGLGGSEYSRPSWLKPATQPEHAGASPARHDSRAAHAAAESARGRSRTADELGRSAAPARLVSPGTAERAAAADPQRTTRWSFDGADVSIRLNTPRRSEQLPAQRNVDAEDSDRHTAASSRTSDAVPQRLDAERSDPSTERLVLEQQLSELKQFVYELAELQSRELAQVHNRLAQIEARLAEVSRAQVAERATSVPDAPPRRVVSDEMPMSGPHTLEGRLLQIWNAFDWEQGRPPLSAIERLLHEASYDLVENIVGTYALAVPARSSDDARTPVYVLPFLGKANALYDDSLFERPQSGDSARVHAAAKVQFAERDASRASLDRLKAGNEKLSQVFTVIQPGRIE